MWNYGDRVDLLTAVDILPQNTGGTCYVGDTKVGATCERQFSWKIEARADGRYYLYTGAFYIGGYTTTQPYPYSESPLTMPVTGFTKFERDVAKLKFTKN
jgi:hypothetical protein